MNKINPIIKNCYNKKWQILVDYFLKMCNNLNYNFISLYSLLPEYFEFFQKLTEKSFRGYDISAINYIRGFFDYAYNQHTIYMSIYLNDYKNYSQLYKNIDIDAIKNVFNELYMKLFDFKYVTNLIKTDINIEYAKFDSKSAIVNIAIIG